MLVDDEKEEFGELEIEQQKIEQKAELPEKYRDKSLDEIVRTVSYTHLTLPTKRIV